MCNKKLKIISALLTVSLVLSLLAVSAFAAGTEESRTAQDGIELTLNTDQATYSVDQDINVTVTVKNTNDYEMTGINVETILPEGYSVKATEGESVIDALAPGELVTLSLVLSSGVTKGLNITDSWIWVLVIVAAVVILGVLIFCFRGKKKTAAHIVPIALVLVGLFAVGSLQVAATAEEKPSITLNKNVSVDGESKEIAVKVSYDAYVAPEKQPFYTGFDTESSINSSTTHGTVQLQYHRTAQGSTGWCADEGYTKPGCAKFDMASVGSQQGDIQWNFNYMVYGGENLLEKGKQYEISFYAKLEGTESIPVTNIVFRDLNDASILYSDASNTVISGNQWTKYTVTLTASETRNVAKLMFQAGGNEATNVKLYIDDITIQ